MPFFFPKHAQNSAYQQRYEQLSAVERGMVLREFIGVTYRRRFQFFRRHHFHKPYRAFKNNLQLAAQKQDKKFYISRRIWRKKPQVAAYLKLIFRHYILGFTVQLLRKQHLVQLQPEPGCYPDAPLILAALEWFTAHEDAINPLIDAEVEQVMAEDSRHLYLYCLRAFLLTRTLVQADTLAEAVQRSFSFRVGGSVPLGAELEFSNLGHRAAFEHSFARHKQDQPYCNFIYFHHFFLEDVSWRLGGYLDHHVRLRRFMPVPWIGGFFEYNLVRIDYPRRFSLPLTLDPGFLARYILQVVAFNKTVQPHSLHLNVECLTPVADEVADLSDYICLLLLGGDLAQDASGVWSERRFARNELMKMVQLRQHPSLFDHERHKVLEYAFLRLQDGRSSDQWLSLIIALIGFNRVTNFTKYCLEPLGELLHWAHDPRPLEDGQIDSFLHKVARGLSGDDLLPTPVADEHMVKLKEWLYQQNNKLR